MLGIFMKKSKALALFGAALLVGNLHAGIVWHSHFYREMTFSSPGACNESNIEIWHRIWPGHGDAVFTLTDIEKEYWAWIITNNAGGKLYCWIDLDEAANEDSPPPPPPPEDSPPPPEDSPPDLPPADNPPAPPEDSPPPPPEPGTCTKHPIAPAKAEKIRNEVDWVDGGPSPLSFARYYRSKSDTDRGLGKGWNHNWGASLSLYPATGPFAAIVKLPSGNEYIFKKISDAIGWTAINGVDKLAQNPDHTWTWQRASDDSQWVFDTAGLLIRSKKRNGRITTYSYAPDGLLTGITNPFGRRMTLGYNAQNQLVSVKTPNGSSFLYSYDSLRRLISVTYPDGGRRQFVYENTTFPNALTGIVDENNRRWGVFSYDSLGRAISSELAGGVSRYEVGYPAAQQSTITDPLGVIRRYTYSSAGGISQVASSSAASGPNTSVIARRTINAQGLVTDSTDFNGNKSTTSWDPSRFLQTDVTEAFGTVNQRSTTYSWHESLRLPVEISKAGRTTTYTYDSQGRALSRTILDKTVTPSTSRTSSWTYNSQGLVETATAANGGTTRYAYDSLGNVVTITNALGHATTYGWDGANRLASIKSPNGTLSTYTYDPRGRMLSASVGGIASHYTYTPSGQLASAQFAHGHR
ncbi:MAG: RHS repeat protein, partial [Burkholderiales bacterium]|nr:RHS repeat protein [Burkholderiales bacterium]